MVSSSPERLLIQQSLLIDGSWGVSVAFVFAAMFATSRSTPIMGAGHSGASGRFKQHRDTAREFAFLLDLLKRPPA